jgi:hypothetical protein
MNIVEAYSIQIMGGSLIPDKTLKENNQTRIFSMN